MFLLSYYPPYTELKTGVFSEPRVGSCVGYLTNQIQIWGRWKFVGLPYAWLYRPLVLINPKHIIYSPTQKTRILALLRRGGDSRVRGY